ncbi:hypothetical protein CC1G_01201 [Coprinopsis cinerea okayama7|uniref:Peroxidase n=1 Tax=Coprinopsis cinerea (strain Okayama-7 / 130 / ATCC MYA-4618 / FGSC 9003) TaxID=240176 RepID=A8NEV6_COPC7|nr:hypothetical protein CC1G_01201 [Coprinopsis cinerea okayama7\|eukprot:XP_001833139.2 hypothetical protein CC1G_01201 [Coprinopsis cinerea okayama7\
MLDQTWLVAIFQVLTLTQTVVGYRWPSPQYDALEGLLYEGRRRDGSNLASIQHPCKNRPGSRASIGAEWLRLAYHDVATHNIETGTGGLDASIAFELDRAENFGNGMHESIEDFETFPSKYISRADVIAIGTILGVASCGGPIIPFRGGRIDALSADVAGVPEPHQDLETHTEIFRRQGFSQEEMIGLVACGHTMGGVRSSDFPDIVPPQDDSERFADFDDTHEFDNDVVVKYIDGTTQNPLVVHANMTLNSDLRIFESDGNATMRRLASPEDFSSTCGTLLEKMLNVVPSNVVLTEEITMLPVKVTDAHLTIENEQLVFKASLRIAQPISAPNKNRLVKIFWCDRYGANKDCENRTGKTAGVASSPRIDDPQVSPLTFRAGFQFVHYDFIVPIDTEESLSKFWFEVDEKDGTKPKRHDNDGEGYVLQQDNVIYVPRLSSISFNREDRTQKTYYITAGVKSGASPSRVYMSAFDSATDAFSTIIDEDVDMALNETLPSAAGYTFYSASIESPGTQLTVDLHAVIDGETYTEDYMQTFFVAGRTPSTKPTNVTIVDIVPPTKDLDSSATANILSLDIIIGLLALSAFIF